MALRALAYIILGALLAVGGVVAFTPAGPVDIQVDVDDQLTSPGSSGTSGERASVSSSDSSGSSSGTAGSTPTSTGGIDTEQIEFNLHAEINEIRQENGLGRLQMDPELQDIARSHSQDMAERGYFAHVSPDGVDVSDRYERAGYNCRVKNDDGSFSTGGENIIATWADQTVDTNIGTLDHDRNETSIAEALAERWMNSEGHRKNILREGWQYEGIGVVAVERDGGTKILATQNFC